MPDTEMETESELQRRGRDADMVETDIEAGLVDLGAADVVAWIDVTVAAAAADVGVDATVGVAADAARVGRVSFSAVGFGAVDVMVSDTVAVAGVVAVAVRCCNAAYHVSSSVASSECMISLYKEF